MAVSGALQLIDLHSHILPEVDDGALDLEAAFAIARMAADDGIRVMAATPHFLPGLYDNEQADIRRRVAQLQEKLQNANIPLHLVVGCDAHIRPDFVDCLKDGRLLRLNDSRYVLFEPPHIIVPQRMEELLFNITASGFVPLLTHPERLKWIEQNYDIFPRLVENGVMMQITAGSLTGRFGKRPQYWAMRMLAEGLVHILATDAHNTTSRPPILSKAFAIAEKEVGLDEAKNLVLSRAVMILDNQPFDQMPKLPANKRGDVESRSLVNRIFAWGRP